MTCGKGVVRKDKEQTDYRKPSWSKRLTCCSVALPSPSDCLMRCHKRQSGFALDQQHTSIGSRGAPNFGNIRVILTQTWTDLARQQLCQIILFRTTQHGTNRTTNSQCGAFAPSYRTIYARRRLRNLVAARQNVLYSINFLGTGGVADEIAASLSYTK